MTFRIYDVTLEIADVGDGRRGEDASASRLGATKDGMYVLDVDAECLRGSTGDAGARETLVGTDGAEHDDAGTELKLGVPDERARFGNGEDENEPESVREPLDGRAGVAVPKDREDCLH